MKDHFTSLSTSKKLAEAGVDKFGKFVWLKSIRGEYVVMPSDVLTPLALHHPDHDYDPSPAYILSELLEMVEGDVVFHKDRGTVDILQEDGRDKYIFADNSILALSKAVLWQKEQ